MFFLCFVRLAVSVPLRFQWNPRKFITVFTRALPILSQMNPVHPVSKMHFNIIHPSTSWFSFWLSRAPIYNNKSVRLNCIVSLIGGFHRCRNFILNVICVCVCRACILRSVCSHCLDIHKYIYIYIYIHVSHDD
jgi:hypothetical protein